MNITKVLTLLDKPSLIKLKSKQCELGDQPLPYITCVYPLLRSRGRTIDSAKLRPIVIIHNRWILFG